MIERFFREVLEAQNDLNSLEKYLMSIKVKKRVALVKTLCPVEEHPILHKLLTNPPALDLVLKFIPPKQRKRVIMREYDEVGKKVNLFRIAVSGLYYPIDSIAIICKYLPEEDLLKSLSICVKSWCPCDYTDVYCQTTLDIVTANIYKSINLNKLSAILGNIRVENLFNVLTLRIPSARNSRSLIARSHTNPELMQCLLKSFPEEQRLKVICIKDESGCSIFDSTIKLPKQFKEVISLLSSHDRIKVIDIPLRTKYLSGSELISVLFEFFPEDQWLWVWKKIHESKSTFGSWWDITLDMSADAKKSMLESQPKERLFDAIKLYCQTHFSWNERRKTPAGRHRKNFEMLTIWDKEEALIFSFFPEKLRDRILISDILQEKTPLYLHIQALKTLGERLQSVDEDKSKKAIDLAQVLEYKVNEFYKLTLMRPWTKTSLQNFKDEFKTLVHSEDQNMQEHREKWKPIVLNILLSLASLGVGLIAIGVKTGVAAINQNPLTVNNCLFFSRTRREEEILAMEQLSNRLGHDVICS